MEYQFEGKENAITAEHLLKNLGYKVETGSQYNEMYYLIAWK